MKNLFLWNAVHHIFHALLLICLTFLFHKSAMKQLLFPKCWASSTAGERDVRQFSMVLLVAAQTWGREGRGKGNLKSWRTGELKSGCSYTNHTFCFSLFLVSSPVFYSLGKVLLFMLLIRSIQTHSTRCMRPSTSLQLHLSKPRDWQNF